MSNNICETLPEKLLQKGIKFVDIYKRKMTIIATDDFLEVKLIIFNG